jgi:hypothetical protein
MNEDVFNPLVSSNANIYKKPGQSKKEFIKQYGQLVFKQNSIKQNEPHKNIIVAFEGRFNNFSKEHKLTIEMLSSMFGIDNIYILISEHSETLSFEDKKEIIIQNDLLINPNNILYKGHFNYNAKHILNTIGIINNIEHFILIVVASIEDEKMLPIEDNKTYYQPWPQELYTCDKKELYQLTNLLPSAKIHGFRFLIESIPSEYNSREKVKSKLPFLMGLKNLRDVELNNVELNNNIIEKQNILKDEFNNLLKNKKSINSNI